MKRGEEHEEKERGRGEEKDRSDGWTRTGRGRKFIAQRLNLLERRTEDNKIEDRYGARARCEEKHERGEGRVGEGR